MLVATLDAEGLRAGEREFAVRAIEPRDRPGEVARVLVAWALDAARDAAPDPLLDPRGRLALPVNVPRTWAPIAATIVFATAALGGSVLFGHDILVKPIPKWLAVGHALLAGTGFILLVLFATGPMA